MIRSLVVLLAATGALVSPAVATAAPQQSLDFSIVEGDQLSVLDLAQRIIRVIEVPLPDAERLDILRAGIERLSRLPREDDYVTAP